MNEHPLPAGRVMALDIGEKRTGVALSDESLLIASPHSTIEARGKKDWLRQVGALVDAENVARILVGLPLNQYGEEGDDAKNTRKFIALLQEGLKVPVVEWDERFSTVQAERALIGADVSREKRKGVIDKVAAAILLQSYLDSLRFHSNDRADVDY